MSFLPDTKYAGDMELWNRFFKYDKLYSLTALIGGYRKRCSNQLGLEFLPNYIEEAKHILQSNVFDSLTQQSLYQINEIKQKLSNVNKGKVNKILNKTLFRKKYRKNIKLLEELYDYPQMIVFDRKEQKFSIRI